LPIFFNVGDFLHTGLYLFACLWSGTFLGHCSNSGRTVESLRDSTMSVRLCVDQNFRLLRD